MKSKLLVVVALLLLFSCGQPLVSDKIPDTPTSGEVKVYCEEGFSTIMKREVFTFEELYTNAKVHVNFVNEKQAIEGLYNDCCKVILLSRVLSASEEKKFNAANLFPRQICVAKNAIAFITASSSADTTLSSEKIKALLSGADTAYKLVFDNENSGVTKYLKDSVLEGKPFGKNCFAAQNTQELVKLVAERKNTIGVMDYSWISDTDETTTKEILTNIRPLAISANEKEKAFYPDQSNIETKEYPFCRCTYIMRRSADFTLGAGFMAFVAGPKGQLLMLKTGLVPAFRQERQVEINTAPLGNQ